MKKRWMAIVLMAVLIWNMAGTNLETRTAYAASKQTIWQKKVQSVPV